MAAWVAGMQERNTMEQLVVTREAVEAYERRTGFVGIGEFFLRKGLFVLKEGETCRKK
ncbi:MAG TPA: hypothetical protein PKZ57_00340 [Methanoregulaceae archaeon]|nr:hypothetical protein [Methanoregulaceae archaeon]HQM55931.1 hypothetical protein [Methanoregulaceae archaeon]HQM55940.1 hypothetical protein [Methanoregulaceae archaeon]HQN90334.1 hypothetical protein [Methanoregulaceae archaeon]